MRMSKENKLIPFDEDKLGEECGVFGIFGYPEASAFTALGLHALQHRGQEAVGIVSVNNNKFHVMKKKGLVGDNFGAESEINSLLGDSAIGHVRYSTAGGSEMQNVQPLYAELSMGGVAIAHNGNLTNAEQIKNELVKKGCIFQSTSDTEVIVHLLAISKKDLFVERLIDVLYQIKGAYSLVILTKDMMIGARDPYGVRPLVLGTKDGSYVLASETCALDIIGAKYERDLLPGEIFMVTKEGGKTIRPFPQKSSRFCLFEYVYFARPDSNIEGRHVYNVRKAIGAELAHECPVEADIVVPVPDSGVPAAIGYAAQTGIPFELGIIRNHYVGRTFIEPTDHIRHLGVKLKHNANFNTINGKRVILVDDSIVRGTTSKKIVNMIREAGAKEVHMRIASPPTSYSCFYGIDTPERSKLISSNHSVDEICKMIGADSLAYLSLDGLYKAVSQTKRQNSAPQFCDACFSGDYPVELVDFEEKLREKSGA